MRRVSHSWLEAYQAALTESDPNKLIGRVEYALNVLERRFSDWGTDPGTRAELSAIRNCISALQRLMRQEQFRDNAVARAIAKAPNRRSA